jgi:subtilisin-like proprotein convertase family protein
VTHRWSTRVRTALVSVLVAGALAGATGQMVVGIGAVPTTAGGLLDVSVAVTLPRTVAGLTVRMRLISPAGMVVLDTSNKRGRLEPSTYVLGFTSDVPAGRLREGRYRLEIQARASGGRTVAVSQALYVVELGRSQLPVSIVVRVAAVPAPASGSTGTAVADAASVRSETAALAQLAAARPDLRLTAVVPAVLADSWRAAGGAAALDATAAPEASSDTADAALHRAILESLTRAVGSGSLSLLSVGYADPDVAALSRIGAADDILGQFALGSSVASDVLKARPSSGTVVWSGPVPAATFSSLASAGIAFAIVRPSAIVPSRGAADATAGPGVWDLDPRSVRALVADEDLSSLLSDAIAPPDGSLEHLFERLLERSRSGAPLVAVVDVGPGSRTTVRDLERALTVLSRAGWIRFTDTREAATAAPVGTAHPRESDAASLAADPRWERVTAARKVTAALLAAAGPEDLDAAACLRSLYLAEARIWTGDREGRRNAHADEADERARAVLSKVVLAVPNVTLSGSTGSVPVSVNNASGRTLRLMLSVEPTDVRLPHGGIFSVEARAGETIVAVPVEMGTSTSGKLDLHLVAGDTDIAGGTSILTTSFVDRLAVAGAVVLALLALLWYIRRRGRAALERLRGASGKRPRSQDRTARDDRRSS